MKMVAHWLIALLALAAPAAAWADSQYKLWRLTWAGSPEPIIARAG